MSDDFQGESTSSPNQAPSGKRKKILIAVGIFVVLGIIGAATGGSNKSSTSTDASSTKSAAAAPSPTKSVATKPTRKPKPVKPLYSAAQVSAAKYAMRISNDTVKNYKWYYARTSPQYVSANAFMLYIGKSADSDPYLRFKIQYFASDWLFIETYTINVDGEIFTISPDYGEVQQDNGIVGGESMIWEWYDVNPTSENIDMIKKIISSKKAVIRSEGKQYYKDRTITQTEKTALKNILITYFGLGGVL